MHGILNTLAAVFGVSRVRLVRDSQTNQLVPQPDPGHIARSLTVGGEVFWVQVRAGGTDAVAPEVVRGVEQLVSELCAEKWGRGWIDKGGAKDSPLLWHVAQRPADEPGPPKPLSGLDFSAAVPVYFPDVCDHCGYSARCFEAGGGWFCGPCLDAANGVTVCGKCRRLGSTRLMPAMGDEWYHPACFRERFGEGAMTWG